MSNAASKTLSPWLRLPNKKLYHVELSTAKGNFERENEVEDTMSEGLEVREASSSTPTAWGDPEHDVVEEKSIDDKLPSVVTNAGVDTLAKETKCKKGNIGSN